MSAHDTQPTPYPEVNAVLFELLSSVQRSLGDQFVGMYLYGSLASGDFSPQTSDIDFVVITTDELLDEVIAALQAMHARIATMDSKWALELEGSYIPQRALCRYDPTLMRHPHIDRGEDALHVMQHDSDWVIQRHILREHGVVLAGPALQTLIDPISASDLRRAVSELLNGWWPTMLDNPAWFPTTGYQAYAVLTMCRALYALEYGTIVSKPVAARWALQTVDERWTALIERALAWRDGASFDDLKETLAFIRYTVRQPQAKREIRSRRSKGSSGCATRVDTTLGEKKMNKMPDAYSVNDHFADKDPALRKLYTRLIATLRSLGPIQEEAKKTSIHLVNDSALAGVEVRKTYLLLNIKSDHKLDSPRVEKTEQISARRFHHKVKLSALTDLDKELQRWLKEAYDLSG